MISVLGSKLTEGAIGTLGVSTTIGIGHLITAFTMLMIHSWRIGSLEQWLDSARKELTVKPDEEEIVQEDEAQHEEEEEIEQEQEEDLDIELVDIPDPVLENDDFE